MEGRPEREGERERGRERGRRERERVQLPMSDPQVQASDADDGVNKQIKFRLASGNENNTFAIHPSSGLITTRNPVVDREGIPLYQLVVEAVDQVSTLQASASY